MKFALQIKLDILHKPHIDHLISVPFHVQMEQERYHQIYHP